jgi:hypothetical protein
MMFPSDLTQEILQTEEKVELKAWQRGKIVILGTSSNTNGHDGCETQYLSKRLTCTGFNRNTSW